MESGPSFATSADGLIWNGEKLLTTNHHSSPSTHRRDYPSLTMSEPECAVNKCRAEERGNLAARGNLQAGATESAAL
jgi:hypothetical protein